MTCDETLLLLLDADPDELLGDAQSAAAAHVRNCAKCRLVADRLRRETGLLAATVAQGADAPMHVRIRPVRAALWIAPGLAAAAIALVVLSRNVTSEPDVPALPTVAAAPKPVPAVADVPASPRRPSIMPLAVNARPVTVVPYVGPESVVAVAVGDAQPDSEAAPTLIVIAERDSIGVDGTRADPVVVTPPRGADVRIGRTRNPSITVVWIH